MANSKRRCKHCKEYVAVWVKVPAGTFCTVEHAASWASSRAKEKQARARRAETKQRKEAIKTKGDWLKEAQAAFNRYIRVRDMRKPCISSGRPLEQEAFGGGYDCGHYRSTGAAPHLRFNVFNAHGQSKHDNRYLSGNVVDYRIRLIKRIGLERVERLEQDNTDRRFTVDYYKRIKSIFGKKSRLYERRFR